LIKTVSIYFQTKTNADGLNILYIHDVTYDQCGEIQCIATVSNQTSTTTASGMLTVSPAPFSKRTFKIMGEKQHPHFSNSLKNCRVFTGSTLAFEVKFQGYPEPQVIWMRTGRPIEDINAAIATKPGCSILTINGINANQSGKYAAFIINNYGSETTSASVTVEGPPDPPSGKPSVALDSQGVTVTWCGPPYDGGCMISGFLLEIQYMDGEWHVLAIVFDTLSYFVKNLTPNKAYKFRIRAKNIYGYSEPGLSSDAILISLLNSEKDEQLNWTECEIGEGEVFSSVYESLEELGRGRFGVVHKVRHRQTGDLRAAKIVKCIKTSDRKKVQEEISIMKSLQHPKLLQLIQCFEASRDITMVVEYISGGELFERVVADDFTLTEKDCIMFMRQICEGVCYMHNLSIVHLDLKPENIMCSTRNSHQVKIIDFGLAQQLAQNKSVRVLLGTPEFVPPEIINYEPIGLQSDMWSIGVICYVLLSGLSPFMGETDVDTFNNITRAEYDFDDDAFDIVSEEAKDFISGLLLYRKEERLSAGQCIQTKWLSLDSSALGNSKICTHKLKKFIVRRKWQKTGNAIRALGRMASLSASRRNSSTLANTGIKANIWSFEGTP
ncbi:myosin light chain kinase, smooth muscle, partial [Aedes albopictus]|uniref:Myosin light chain kinase, smooth muscle n=1 Tax=Aedes albopictus TaxID=7160 RepID=A0ABM1XXU7_AEDAL